MKRHQRTAAFAAMTLIAALALSACGPKNEAPAADEPAKAQTIAAEVAAAGGPEGDGITVSGSGTVRLTPDRATVSFGVTTEESTAEKAQSENSRAVDRVVQALTALGIEEKSIRTSGYGMYPRYDYSAEKERLVGYTVYTTMIVEDQTIDSLGSLLNACVEAGINRVDSVSFLCSGYDEAYREALGQAVAAARVKAESLAKAAGRTLGAAVTVTEGWQDTSARYANAAKQEFPAAEAAMDMAMPSFQPGETEITANVTVTYAFA